MPRTARLLSETGFYHVILRGISKQIIFEDDYDYMFFLSKLKKYCSETDVTVTAFCLMSNHVHLLLNDQLGNLSVMMKKIGVSYSGYFNRKYERVGHLFQDRFLSETITSERQLMIVIRYILNNPQKAGMCTASEYKWSSYHAYGDKSSFVDTDLLAEIFESTTHYTNFISASDNDYYMEHGAKRRNDKWVKSLICEIIGEQDPAVLRLYEKRQRDRVLRELRQRGVSIRQLERLTGIPRGAIQRV